MSREHIPAETDRAVRVEAGHRCAIPTCRKTPIEIAHIVPYSKTHNNSFEKLIALCPNCHTLYDREGKIDQKSMNMYKQNLGILNNRYNNIERRLFDYVAETKNRTLVLGAGGDILVRHAIKDGLLEDQKQDTTAIMAVKPDGSKEKIQTCFTFYVTNTGMDFIKRYAKGYEIT